MFLLKGHEVGARGAWVGLRHEDEVGGRGAGPGGEVSAACREKGPPASRATRLHPGPTQSDFAKS